MEINRFDDVIGGVAQEDMVEGRFVLMTSDAFGGDFINVNADLPGFKLPDTAEEAKRAKFCVTFAVDNRPAPIVDFATTPWDTRGGWGGNTPNGPLTGLKMWLTHPGNQEGQTIPSGYKALGYTEGTFTLPSGAYIYNASLVVPGAAFIIADAASDSAADAGKVKYTATMAAGVIGFVETYDSATGRLTVRVE